MKISFTLIGLFVFGFLNAQKAGMLDSSFGMGGIVINHDIGCDALCVQTNQKIILAGYSKDNFKLSRYNTDGSLDQSFGEKGYTASSFGSLHATAIVTDHFDNIFVTGGFSDINIIKFTKEGKVDSAFAKNGLQVTNLGQYEFPYDIKLQADGKIIIAGITYDDPFNPQIRIFIARFNVNGSLDLSFGNNGFVINSSTILKYSTAKLIIQPDAKIIVGGSINQGDADFFLSRYNSDGSTDKSFGTNGNIITRFSNNDDYLNALVLQADGKIIAGGQGNYMVLGSKPANMLLIRYNADGTIDKNFGSNGTTVISYGADYSGIHDLLLQDDNKIIVAGFVTDRDQTFEKFALARIDKYGITDSTFGNNGTQTTAIGYYAFPSGAALQTNNKIIVGGNVYSGIENYSAVVRYNNDDLSKKQIIIKKIKHYAATHNNAQATLLNNVFIYPNPAQNVLHVAGLSSNKSTLTVVDFMGNIKLQAVANTSSYNLNIATLIHGNYLLKIEMNDDVVTKQSSNNNIFIIEKLTL